MTYFAYSFPYSLTEMRDHFSFIQKAVENRPLYCFREVVTFSAEGRPMEMITLTSREGKLDEEESALEC